MISKTLTIVLIPLLVLGNSFATSSCGAAQSSCGQNRAHIHVGIGHPGIGSESKSEPGNAESGEAGLVGRGHDKCSHVHDNESHSHSEPHRVPEQESNRQSEHDVDAIYLLVPAGELSPAGSVVIDSKSDGCFGEACNWRGNAALLAVCPSGLGHHFHGPPLYLLHATLRI